MRLNQSSITIPNSSPHKGPVFIWFWNNNCVYIFWASPQSKHSNTKQSLQVPTSNSGTKPNQLRRINQNKWKLEKVYIYCSKQNAYRRSLQFIKFICSLLIHFDIRQWYTMERPFLVLSKVDSFGSPRQRRAGTARQLSVKEESY